MVRAVLRGKKEEAVSPKIAAKIRPLIKKGVTLITRLAQTKIAIEENNGKLLPFAEDLRVTTGLGFSIFKSDAGEVTVKFGDAINYSVKDMPKIKKILGPLFPKMFHEVPVFAVSLADIPEIKQKLGRDFDRLVSQDASYTHTKDLRELLCDGDSAVGKQLRDLVRIEEKKPSIGYEAPAVAAFSAAKSMGMPPVAQNGENAAGKKKGKAA
jgi:hypothetical protein